MPHELNISILNTGTITAGTGSGIATSEVFAAGRFFDYGSHIEVVNGQCYDPVMGYVKQCSYKDGQSSIKILGNIHATLDNIKMKVTNEGTIVAGQYGIIAPGAIINKGSIKSSFAGIGAVKETTRIENYKDIIAADEGIRAYGAEELEIVNEGTITAGDFDEAVEDSIARGIVTGAIKSIINKGQITSKETGIDTSALSLLNFGTINAQELGVDFSGITFTNTGVIDAQKTGVYTSGHFFNTSPGKIYGRSSYGVSARGSVRNDGEIHGGTTGVSITGSESNFAKLINTGDIYATNTGIYAKYAIVENYGTITVSDAEGTGINASGGTVYNGGSIVIGSDTTAEKKEGEDAGYCATHECYYGTGAEGRGWYKTRTGSGKPSDPYVYSDFYAKNNRFIVLENDAKLLTSGTLSSEGTLNLNAFSPDGTGSVSLIKGGKLEAENIVGNLHIDASNVKGGFANDYTVESAIHAPDVSGLRLMSDSVLFTAKLADNGSDVVMTRRSFNDLVANKSLAGFLEMNYAAGNGEGFFNMLKNIGTASEFAGTLSDITAKDTFSRFAYEDLTAMREVNFAMNEAMFANDDKPLFETTGSVNGFGFKSDNNSQSQYALATKRVSPRFKVGYAMSNTTLNSDDDNDTTRRNQLFQVFAPIGYERAGVKLISTPQIGFARGHYTRASDGNGSYKGVIEKRTFALMNEARYPMSFGKYEVAPTVEFNAIAYNQKGREDAKAYALTMPSDTNVSIEGGVGLRLSRAAEVGHDSKLSMTAGVMMYREFADPYNIKMGMQGMEGSFELYDERSPYRAVASFGFGYDLGSVNMYGSIQHCMQSDTYTKAKAGFKLGF